jgi:hypothetical protein
MGREDRNSTLKGRLLESLQHPTRLRLVLTGLVLLIGYAGVYLPLMGEIDDTRRKLAAEQKRLDLAQDVERLREQWRAFKGCLPAKVDSSEWVQYVLAGIRRFPLKLVLLDPEAPRELGPYKVSVLRVELEGSFVDLHAFVRWLKTNERLFRIDAVRLEPQRSGTGLGMQLTLLGVMG